MGRVIRRPFSAACPSTCLFMRAAHPACARPTRGAAPELWGPGHPGEAGIGGRLLPLLRVDSTGRGIIDFCCDRFRVALFAVRAVRR